MIMKFYDVEHEQGYKAIISRMAYADEYHNAVAYLLALDNVTRKHVSDVFNFADDCIVPDALSKAWQTSTSLKTTRLAFNLWCGWCSDSEEEPNAEAYSVASIFNSGYAEYYLNAIGIRFNINN